MIKKPNTPALPRFIALCGYPKAGKTMVQEILSLNFSVTPVDDGGPLREIAMKYLGCTWDQVYTQPGKLRYIDILDKSWQIRGILGELGNAFEEKFGGDVIPLMVCNSLQGAGPFSFGSVRREQGVYYKERGGVVIGIRNKLAEPSPYKFDRFNPDLVDHWIENDALWRGLDPFSARKDLEEKVTHLVQKIAA